MAYFQEIGRSASVSKEGEKSRTEQNINNKIRAYMFKNYYQETYGQTAIHFDTNCLHRIIKEYCLNDDISKRKLLILYCHNENDAFGKTVCDCWFQTEEIQTALSNPNVIVTGHNITNESHRNNLKAYMSSLFDCAEILALLEFEKSRFYVIIPNDNKIYIHVIIDKKYSKDLFTVALNDSIELIRTLTKIESFDEYYKATFGETRINFNTTSIEEVIQKYCLIDDLSKRKILVVYCHNENNEFGKEVCEKWFQCDQIQDLLSDSRFIVAGYNIPNESRKIKYLQKESLIDLLASKFYIYIPLEGKMIPQACIGSTEFQLDVFVDQLNNFKEIFDKLVKYKQVVDEPQESTCESFQEVIFNKKRDKDFDIYSADEHQDLIKNIGFGYFGPPSSTKGYNDKQQKLNKKAFNAIMTQSDKYANDDGVVVISIIFACCVKFVEKDDKVRFEKNQFNTMPVFILRKCKPHHLYKSETDDYCRIVIDSTLRVYSSWRNFLNENKYPKGLLLYVPKNGEYKSVKDKVDCAYYYTPANGIGKTVIRGLDNTSAIAGIGSGGLLLIAAIPAVTVAPIAITGAVVAGIGAGIYSIGRSVANLVDRGKHDENLSVLNAEARAAYLGILAGAFGFAGAGANTVLVQLAKNGTDVAKTALASVNVLSKANIAVSSLPLGSSAYDVTRSYIVDGEKPSTLTLVQLGASALFFGNSVYNYRSAATIVSEAQNSRIQEMSDDMRSNRHRKMFNKLQKETVRLSGGDKAVANAKVISTIRNAGNVDETMAILTRNNKRFNKLGIKLSANDGHVSFNGKTMNVLQFSKAVNAVQISEVMTLPPEQISSGSFKSSLNIPWIEIGLNLKSTVQQTLDPSVIKFTNELLKLFAPHIRKNIVSLVDNIWPNYQENSRESRLTIHNILHHVVDFICAEARKRLNLGTLGNGCVHVVQLLVNFYFFGQTIDETVIDACSTFITFTLSKKIKIEEEIEQEQKKKEKIMKNTRTLVKCDKCAGCHNQKKKQR